MPGSRRLLIAAACAGLALRLAFAFGYWTHEALTRDEREYLSLARSLAYGRGLTYDASLGLGELAPFSRAPGYPAFLALVGGGNAPAETVPPAVKIAQGIGGAFTILLIGVIGERVAGARAGVAAAWIAAAYPPLIWMCSRAFSEPLYAPIGLATALLIDIILARSDRRSGAVALGCGLVAGVGALVRPAMLLVIPLALVWLAWRRRPRAVAGLAVGAAMMILPWTARNYAVYHRFVLIASEGGITFWTGNNAHARGDGDLAANPLLKPEVAALRAAHPGFSQEAMDPIYYGEAVAWMRAHPLAWVALETKKAFYLIVPVGPSYRLHSPLYYGATLISYLGLLPFAIAGGLRTPRRAAPVGLGLLLAASILICLIFFPQERFRLPVIDPALVIFAGVAAGRWRARTGRA